MTWVSVEDRMPESGQHVLFFWRNALGKARIGCGHWVRKHTVEALDECYEFGDYDEATDTYYVPEGWHEWGWELEFSATPDGEVTHWHELPSVPVSDGEGGAR